MGKEMFDGPLLGKETPEIDMSCDPPIHELVQVINLQAQRIVDLEIAVSQLQGQFYERVDEWRRMDERVDEARFNVRDRALSQMKHEMECQTRNAEKSN